MSKTQVRAKSAYPGPPVRHPATRTALLRGWEVFIAIALLTGLFFLLTGWVLYDRLQPISWDKTVTHEIQEIPSSPVGVILTAISWPGFAPQNWVIPPLLVALMLLRHWFIEAAFTALASAGGLLAEIVKAIIHRPRPTPDLAHIAAVLNSPSFPSGHVTSYVTLYGFLFYLVYTLFPLKSPFRWILLAVFALLVLLVGISRVYMGQHWASDALAGYALGFAWLLTVVELYRLWMRRHPKKAEGQ